MFNFKKIKEAVTELTSIVLTATLSVGMFSATPVQATPVKETKAFTKQITLVGNAGSGKTQLLQRMETDTFDTDCLPTRNACPFTHIFKFVDSDYQVQINDTCAVNADEVRYCIKNSDAIILAIAYDDETWEASLIKWLDCINANVEKLTPLKIVFTKSDIPDEGKQITDERGNALGFDEHDYKNLTIDNVLIETSAKHDLGIRTKKNAKMDPENCLEDYLLKLFDSQKQSSNTEATKQVHSNTNQSQPKTNTFGKNNNKGKSIFQQSTDFVKKHPVISIGLVTVVPTLIVFRNQIIKGIESIFGKKQIKKPLAKRIKITN